MALQSSRAPAWRARQPKAATPHNLSATRAWWRLLRRGQGEGSSVLDRRGSRRCAVRYQSTAVISPDAPPAWRTMVLQVHCYVCALVQQATPAVATCKICSVGLCMEHRVGNEQRSGPGGMTGYTCLHRSSDLTGGHRLKTPLPAVRGLRDALGRTRAVVGARRRARTWAPGPDPQGAGQH